MLALKSRLYCIKIFGKKSIFFFFESNYQPIVYNIIEIQFIFMVLVFRYFINNNLKGSSSEDSIEMMKFVSKRGVFTVGMFQCIFSNPT